LDGEKRRVNDRFGDNHHSADFGNEGLMAKFFFVLLVIKKKSLC